jgi:hypothetical protein
MANARPEGSECQIHSTSVGAFWRVRSNLWGTSNMLSVDQFLRLISLPAVVAAFLIASQVSGAGVFHSQPAQLAGE